MNAKAHELPIYESTRLKSLDAQFATGALGEETLIIDLLAIPAR
jgi:hypothetical protein